MPWNSFYLAAGAAKILALPFLPLRGTEGEKHIPDGPCIIAANHSGAHDAAVLALAYAEAKRRPLHMLVDGDPPFGWFLRRCGAVPPKELKVALGWLAANAAVGIFPEQQHVALLALESGAPVVPAAIPGGRARVRFGRPVELMEKELRYAALPSDERKNLVGNVGYRIMHAIAELADRECGE